MESKMKEAALFNPVGLKSFEFSPLGVTPGPVHRWQEFVNYLLNNEKVSKHHFLFVCAVYYELKGGTPVFVSDI